MAGGGGGGMDPSMGGGMGGLGMLGALIPGFGPAYQRAQQQRMQRIAWQQQQVAEGQGDATLRTWAGQGGGAPQQPQAGAPPPMPGSAPGSQAPSPQPVAPGQGSVPAAPVPSPGQVGGPNVRPMPPPPPQQQNPMLQRAAFPGPAPQVGGGGREGEGSGGADYGPAPGQQQHPQMQQNVPLPPTRPPGFGVGNPPPQGFGGGNPYTQPRPPMQNAPTGIPSFPNTQMARDPRRDQGGPQTGPGTGQSSMPPVSSQMRGTAPLNQEVEGAPRRMFSRYGGGEAPGNMAAVGNTGPFPQDLASSSVGAASRRQESGSFRGNYNADNGVSVGAYQVSRRNLPVWTASILGRSYSPEEFKRDPAAQDKVYNTMMGKYIEKTGNLRDAFSMWNSGKDYAHAAASHHVDMGKATTKYADQAVVMAAHGEALDRAARGDRQSASLVNSSPEGRAALAQAQNGQLDLRAAISYFIQANPNAKPGDMIRALQVLQPFMNMESQAENRRLQEADRQERLYETERHHEELEDEAKQRQKGLDFEREQLDYARQEGIRQRADKAAADAQTKAQAELDRLDKEWREDRNNLDTRITGKETAISNLGDPNSPLGKKMQGELDQLNKERDALVAAGKPSERKSAGKGRDQGTQTPAEKPTGKGKPLPPDVAKELEGADPNDPDVQEYKKMLKEKYGYDVPGM